MDGIEKCFYVLTGDKPLGEPFPNEAEKSTDGLDCAIQCSLSIAMMQGGTKPNPSLVRVELF